MKEKDYIAATNLVNIRLVRQLIRDILVDGEVQLKNQEFIQKILYNWEAVSEKRLGV